MIGRRPAESVRRFAGVGFDLDHTLLRYRMRPFCQLIYDAAASYLVEAKGYPAQLFPQTPEEAKQKYRMMFRAILDHASGHLLKVDSKFFVQRGFHGFRALPPATLRESFGPLCQVDPRALEVFRGDRHTFFHDFYGAGVVPLVAQIASLRETADYPLLRNKSFAEIVRDIFEGANHNYTIKDFRRFDDGAFDGHWYPRLMSEPARYVNPIGRRFLDKLDALRAAGKRVFIVSNNYFAPSDRVLRAAVGPDWLNHFDFAFFEADKPSFFHEPKAGTVCHDLEGKRVEQLDEHLAAATRPSQKVFTGGNAAQISRLLSKHCGSEYEAAFFGDSIYADCVYAFNSTINPNWAVFLILEELQELERGYPDHEYFNYVSHWGSALHDKSLTGVAPTYIFHVASQVAHQAFSSVESPEALRFFTL